MFRLGDETYGAKISRWLLIKQCGKENEECNLIFLDFLVGLFIFSVEWTYLLKKVSGYIVYD